MGLARKAAAVMRFSAETTSDGVTERVFTVGDLPGAVWAPAGADAPRPLVLLGHGGAGHKTARPIAGRARRYVTGSGFAVAAIDAPGWGGRSAPAEYEPFNAEIEELTAAGKPLGDAFARRGVVAAKLAIPEWRATIDACRCCWPPRTHVTGSPQVTGSPDKSHVSLETITR